MRGNFGLLAANRALLPATQPLWARQKRNFQQNGEKPQSPEVGQFNAPVAKSFHTVCENFAIQPGMSMRIVRSGRGEVQIAQSSFTIPFTALADAV